MAIDPSIFKSYDIRAIYPTQLDEEGIRKITKSILKLFREKIGEDKDNLKSRGDDFKKRHGST